MDAQETACCGTWAPPLVSSLRQTSKLPTSASDACVLQHPYGSSLPLTLPTPDHDPHRLLFNPHRRQPFARFRKSKVRNRPGQASNHSLLRAQLRRTPAFSADVLCHASGPPPAGRLRNCTASLRPVGRLILNLPAYHGCFPHTRQWGVGGCPQCPPLSLPSHRCPLLLAPAGPFTNSARATGTALPPPSLPLMIVRSSSSPVRLFVRRRPVSAMASIHIACRHEI